MFDLPIEGPALFSIPFGDIVDYASPYTLILFLFAALFTALAILSRPEQHADIIFGEDGVYTGRIPGPENRFQRFMAIACGLAAMGATVSGDIFNFCIFTSMVGLTCIGIVASSGNRHVLNAAFEYGIVTMIAMIPLFGGAAIVAATTGTLSIWELAGGAIAVPFVAKAFLVLGVMGEGMAPFYVAKAEITRAQGAPYILMIHVSSLLIFLRIIEIIITI
ncbi:MAG: hypothetical protein JXA44_04295 [Methanospirillaceae archaeon]|nr:hypothetical protein [Methanospirillaceae archaeon]